MLKLQYILIIKLW